MREFYVQESVLDTAAERLTDLDSRVPLATAYADDHLSSFYLGETGLLLVTIRNTARPAREDVLSALRTVSTHLAAAAAEIAATAALYRATDDAVDQALDATY